MSVPGSREPDRAIAAEGFDAEAARLYRQVWGRALAALVRLLRDLDAAEDALQEAWLVALTRWRADGFPTDPTAWLITTARNKAIDRIRRDPHIYRETTLAGRGLHDHRPFRRYRRLPARG